MAGRTMTYQIISEDGGSLGEDYQTLAIAIAYAKTANGILHIPVHILSLIHI